MQALRSKASREAIEMNYRFLFLFGAVSLAAAPPAVGQTPLTRQENVTAQTLPATQAPAPHDPVIRFEDASDKAGINFTHSFGSRQLGSLLEGTGAGCIWFDYNNAAQSSLSQQRQRHLYRRDGEIGPQSGHVWDSRDGGGL
jgi:hypothetical protein